jgi:hypothetical protein
MPGTTSDSVELHSRDCRCASCRGPASCDGTALPSPGQLLYVPRQARVDAGRPSCIEDYYAARTGPLARPNCGWTAAGV